jgi:succinate dehydrogenase / fumarate reductase cytochrome b subunit
LNSLLKALTSSVGKKFVMALTGLLLCGFLVVHLGGNLLLYVGADAYNKYAHTLHSQEWFVKTAEVGLLVLFVAHIGLAISTSRENRAARKVRYLAKTSKLDACETTSVAPFSSETWMFLSGAAVLAFLLLHLADFHFELRLKGAAGEEPFDKAVRILNDQWSFWCYIVGCIILGLHLTHGFASAFQSLGLNHPKYNKLIRWFGIAFAIAIGIGFAMFPLWGKLLHQVPAAMSGQ